MRFGTGSAPGCARQTGHVCVFGSAKYASSQRQNIFVRVFRCTWISSPTTVSQSATEQLPRLAQRELEAVLELHGRAPVFERALHLDKPQLALAVLERELHVADEHRARAVEDAHVAEHAPACGDEVGCRVDERPLHRSRSGTVSNASACSRAWPVRKSVFSPSCGPISCRPTGRPSLSPHGIESPGSPAMHEGIVSRSLTYIASGSCVFAPSANATVGDVGDASTSKRSKSSACSRMISVRTFCAWP